MKATYIPTRNPNEASPQARETLRQITHLLTNAKNLPEEKRTEALLQTEPEHLLQILHEISGTLTPEKLAACLARYSRSNQGIEQIITQNENKSPDAIFKMVDYGHASIAGLTGGIAIAIDGISMLLAYKLFEAAQMADGQESSTRYIQLSKENLPNPETIGIPNQLKNLWEDTCLQGFQIYETLRQQLQQKVEKNPAAARLPEKALNNQKIKERMLKNYALDRCRYFLPVATLTNTAIVATARTWADILKLTESLSWPEAKQAAALLRTELLKASPNLVRHSHPDNASTSFQKQLQTAGQRQALKQVPTHNAKCQCRLDIFNPKPKFQHLNPNIEDSLNTRQNRYSHTGAALKRITVQTEWSAIALAELRDLNRHRTGFRFSTMAPAGFFRPNEIKNLSKKNQNKFLKQYKKLVQELAKNPLPGFQAYGYFLGTQVPFEHTQQANNFLYELELRTGLGAHFKYAEHLAQAGKLFFKKFPEAKKYIKIGTAEPE